MDDAPKQSEYNQLGKILEDAIRPKRYGFKKSMLCQSSVEYILQRENVLAAIRSIQQVDWQNINPNNKELAEQIKEQVLHSLAVMIQSMRRIELDYL